MFSKKEFSVKISEKELPRTSLNVFVWKWLLNVILYSYVGTGFKETMIIKIVSGKNKKQKCVQKVVKEEVYQ